MIQEHLGPGQAHMDGGDAIHASRAGSGIPGDPVQRHDQRGRVADEVVDIVKPATTVGRRPTVQLGLHLPYP